MKRAADFRAEARAALKGHWRLAVGVGFLAMVLGGVVGIGAPDVKFGLVDGNFQIYLDVLGQSLNPVEMMRSIRRGQRFCCLALFFRGRCSGCNRADYYRIVC